PIPAKSAPQTCPGSLFRPPSAPRVLGAPTAMARPSSLAEGIICPTPAGLVNRYQSALFYPASKHTGLKVADDSECRPPSGRRIRVYNFATEGYQLDDPSKLGPTYVWKNIPAYVGSIYLNAVDGAAAGMIIRRPDGVWEGTTARNGLDRSWWHNTGFLLLPITSEHRWVDATDGDVPNGCNPLVGGYDGSGGVLHYAMRDTPSGPVLGVAGKSMVKAGGGTGGAAFTPPDHFASQDSFLSSTLAIASGYKILCWNF
ncbi:hypothetical protein OIO90_006611, partial [Microbotryomycetes sp. JL221]